MTVANRDRAISSPLLGAEGLGEVGEHKHIPSAMKSLRAARAFEGWFVLTCETQLTLPDRPPPHPASPPPGAERSRFDNTHTPPPGAERGLEAP
jgi:hypothetical protein